MATNIKVGTYTGTGAALNVSLGFVPDYVRIVNVTGLVVDEWFSNMTTQTSFTNSTDTVAAAIRAAPNGVSIYTGSTSAAVGFTVGTGLSTNASVYRYVAMQNGPGAQ